MLCYHWRWTVRRPGLALCNASEEEIKAGREKEKPTWLGSSWTFCLLSALIAFRASRHSRNAPRAPTSSSPIIRTDAPLPLLALPPPPPYRFCKNILWNYICCVVAVVLLPHAPFPLVHLILSRQLNYPIKWIKKNLWLFHYFIVSTSMNQRRNKSASIANIFYIRKQTVI